MEDLINKIKETGYIENPKMGSYFHNKYPQLFRQIFNETKDLEDTYKVNTTLRARVIFLIKYKKNITQIINGHKWKSFDRNLDDFISRSTNSAKKGWDDSKSIMESTEVITKKETIEKLKTLTNDDIFGKSKNRVIMKHYPKLYKSIYTYSSQLNTLNSLSKKFPSRVIFIRDFHGEINNLLCPICNVNYCLYSEEKKYFNSTCKKCYLNKTPKYPQKSWFKVTYGENWKSEYEKDRKKISEMRVNSEGWFIKTYGNKLGLKKRIEYLISQENRISKLKNNGVSKISQELFWKIYKRLDTVNDCYFSELNKEVLLRNDDNIYFPDFVYKNKIIEYDGKYWHNEDSDKLRNEFYTNMGYEVFIVNSDEYNRNKKSEDIIDKCVKFLTNED